MKLFGRLPELVFGLIIGIVMIQVAIAAIEPYMGMIGKTFAALIIVLIIGGIITSVVALIRRLRNNSQAGPFNGGSD